MNNRFFRHIILFSIFLCILLVCQWISDFKSQDNSPAPNIIESDQIDNSLSDHTGDTVECGAEKEPAVLVKDTIKPNETFAHALKRNKLDSFLGSQIIKGFSQVIDFRKSRPGDSFSISLNDYGEVIRCTYERGLLEIYALEPDLDSKDGYHAFRDSVLLERRLTKLSGVVDSSLSSAFSKIGGNNKLAVACANIFSSKLDFNTETRPGDQFNILVEEYFKDDQFVGYGRILAARYKNDSRVYAAYYYQPDGQTEGKYFDTEGYEVGSSFLRSPLQAYRVTSTFSKRRLHPILKFYRPHYGVDLAAPTGTKVMAAADGIVSFAGWQRGFGRIVILKHKGGYKTYYGHLSGFARGVKKGVKVNQKQIIGYVGASGLATGPHLDYRIAVNGVFKDPFKMKFKPNLKLSGKALDEYMEKQGFLSQFLDDDQSPQILASETLRVRKRPDGWVG